MSRHIFGIWLAIVSNMAATLLPQMVWGFNLSWTIGWLTMMTWANITKWKEKPDGPA